MGSEEREAVLLELRSHFEERQRQSHLHLLSALDHMGSPEALAREFLEASTTPAAYAARRSAGGILLPAVIANSNLPTPYRRNVPRLAIREMIGDYRATLAATGDGLWGACVFLVGGFTITSFIVSLQGLMPERIDTPSWILFVVRLAISLIGTAIAYRCILDDEDDLWSFDLPLLRFLLASTLLMGATFVPSAMIRAAAQSTGLTDGDVALPFYHQPLALLVTVGVHIALLRVQPWAVAIAMGRPISLRASWVGTSGKTLALATGWLCTVAPLFALHVVVELATQQLSPGSMVRFGLLFSLADGVLSMGFTISQALLNAIAFRWVMREAIPAPRPFSSTRPTDAEIAETNLRFRRFLAEKARRDMENSVRTSPPGY